MTKKDYSKRTYRNLTQPVQDVQSLWRLYRAARAQPETAAIAPMFRERLMLAITGVNQCRYCTYVHTRNALSQGVPAEQIRDLVEQDLHSSPADELPALLYAQHWAETAGQVDVDARRTLLETYGLAQTQAIELVLQTIQIANLSGNTWDYLLYRLGFLSSAHGGPGIKPAEE